MGKYEGNAQYEMESLSDTNSLYDMETPYILGVKTSMHCGIDAAVLLLSIDGVHLTVTRA